MKYSIQVEVNCPKHGLERYIVKIITQFNIASQEILPKERTKPFPDEIRCLYVGRNVGVIQVTNYLTDYFRERGMLDYVKMKFLT